jgi:hypothetical protein
VRSSNEQWTILQKLERQVTLLTTPPPPFLSSAGLLQSSLNPTPLVHLQPPALNWLPPPAYRNHLALTADESAASSAIGSTPIDPATLHPSCIPTHSHSSLKAVKIGQVEYMIDCNPAHLFPLPHPAYKDVVLLDEHWTAFPTFEVNPGLQISIGLRDLHQIYGGTPLWDKLKSDHSHWKVRHIGVYWSAHH